MGRLVAGA